MKKFIIKASIYILPLYIVVLYFKLLVLPNLTGDLGRLGMITFGNEYDSKINTKLNEPYIVDEYVAKPISDCYSFITIGDSFSQQKKGGYQNFLALFTNQKVLNIAAEYDSPEQTAINLLKRGIINKKNCKVLIIESVERKLLNRLKEISFSQSLNTPKTESTNQNAQDINILYKTTSWIRLSLGYDNAVKHCKLDNKYFSVPLNGNILYFYEDDLDFRYTDMKSISSSIKKLSELNQFVKNQNIQLIYLIATDKYHFYQDKIINNIYPQNYIMDSLSQRLDSGFVINSGFVLQKHVTNKMDLYRFNDSHWSPEASVILANEIIRYTRK